jgi:hypothetical protein
MTSRHAGTLLHFRLADESLLSGAGVDGGEQKALYQYQFYRIAF